MSGAVPEKVCVTCAVHTALPGPEEQAGDPLESSQTQTGGHADLVSQAQVVTGGFPGVAGQAPCHLCKAQVRVLCGERVREADGQERGESQLAAGDGGQPGAAAGARDIWGPREQVPRARAAEGLGEREVSR